MFNRLVFVCFVIVVVFSGGYHGHPQNKKRGSKKILINVKLWEK